MRVVLSSPTYGPVDPQCARMLRYATMVAGNRGIQWVGDASTDRQSYGSARNTAIEAIKERGEPYPDGIMWADSDILCENDSIWRLLSTASHFSYDFLSGVYHHRRGGNGPVIYRYTPERETFRQLYMYEPDKIIEAEGCGFGFVYTSWKLIEAIEKLPSFQPDKGRWFPDYREGYGKFGEDLGFSYQAMKAGFQLYVDTGIQVGHVGEAQVITRETYIKTLAEGKDLREVVPIGESK